MKNFALMLICFAFVGTACAEAPLQSLRPVARDATEARAALSTQEDMRQPVVEEKLTFWQSLRPRKRSQEVRVAATQRQAQLARGMVCGDPAIQGTAVGYVSGKSQGCGVSDAVKIRSISGITLSQQSVMDCTTARALKSWINAGLTPAVAQSGGGVSEIHVVSHYSCRSRSTGNGRKISEHGKGRAIDIAGFVLRDGSQISVLRDWGSKAWGKTLKAMHATACGPFGTVLGPNANRAHRDHFHFDTARYRSGSYCR